METSTSTTITVTPAASPTQKSQKKNKEEDNGYDTDTSTYYGSDDDDEIQDPSLEFQEMLGHSAEKGPTTIRCVWMDMNSSRSDSHTLIIRTRVSARSRTMQFLIQREIREIFKYGIDDIDDDDSLSSQPLFGDDVEDHALRNEIYRFCAKNLTIIQHKGGYGNAHFFRKGDHLDFMMIVTDYGDWHPFDSFMHGDDLAKWLQKATQEDLLTAKEELGI